MRLITLSNGQQTQISDEDFIWASGFSWHVDGRSYVYRTIGRKNQRLHRLIAKKASADCTNFIDHIDNNKLNNQRPNLRAATQGQNQMNRGKIRNNTSGYKGVFRHKQNQKWRAQIQIKGESIYLGSYNTKEAAAFAYKIAAEKYHGEFANIGV